MVCTVYGGFFGEVVDVLVCNEVFMLVGGPSVALEALSKMLAGGIKVGATNPPTNQQPMYAVSTTYPTTMDTKNSVFS